MRPSSLPPTVGSSWPSTAQARDAGVPASRLRSSDLVHPHPGGYTPLWRRRGCSRGPEPSRRNAGGAGLLAPDRGLESRSTTVVAGVRVVELADTWCDLAELGRRRITSDDLVVAGDATVNIPACCEGASPAWPLRRALEALVRPRGKRMAAEVNAPVVELWAESLHRRARRISTLTRLARALGVDPRTLATVEALLTVECTEHTVCARCETACSVHSTGWRGVSSSMVTRTARARARAASSTPRRGSARS